MASRVDPDALLLLVPADHVIADSDAFAHAIALGINAAADGSLVTFGVEPDCPHTGYGYIETEKSNSPELKVERFVEKPPGDNGLINGGFFVLQPDVVGRIAGDDTPFEARPLEGLAHDGQLMAYRHGGFWKAMDTLRDKNELEALWAGGQAPWRLWA